MVPVPEVMQKVEASFPGVSTSYSFLLVLPPLAMLVVFVHSFRVMILSAESTERQIFAWRMIR